MTSVFTSFFRGLLFDSLDKTVPIDPATNLMNGKSVYWVYFRSHAAFVDDNDPRYSAIKTVADLAAVPGWSAPLSPQSATHAIGTATAGTTTYCIDNIAYVMGGGWTESTVTAAALVLVGTYGSPSVTNPVIYVTDTPFPAPIVMGPADTLIARPIPAVPGNRALFSWPVFVTGQPQTVPTAGAMAVLEAPPAYEMAYTQHAWLYPQRVNFVANPSFELGVNHWRAAGTLTRVQSTESLPAAPGGGGWYGKVVGGGTVVAESNTFPLDTRVQQTTDQWTIQAMVRGTGKLRVGMVSWEPDFLETDVDWGEETWDLPPNGFLHIYALRRVAEGTTGLVRFECDGGEMHVDNVLCEPDWLRDWPYFDGDSTYGARDDFTWYGGENRKGQTYSLWYNHKRAVTGRLFAWDISSEDFVITDEEVEAQGYVYKWIPAGVRVTPHLDVLYPGDIQEVIPATSGSVIPYKTGPTDDAGITNPWT